MTRLSPKARAWAAWGLLALLFAATQFTKEVNRFFGKGSYPLLKSRPFGAPFEWMEKRTGFEVYHPTFWGKAGYTGLILALMVGSLWFFTRNRGERKLVFGLLGMAALLVLAANVASKVLNSRWLETFSRDTAETLTSPFPVIFLVPVLILYRNGGRRG